MATEIGLWRLDTDKPTRVLTASIPLESTLEALIEAEPQILGEPVMFIGRQVPTAHGKFIDLLAIDGDGMLHILELKRDKTPREVVAQALDYGSWVEGLDHGEVLAIFEAYRPGVPFEQAFSTRFGTSPPEELNAGHRMTIVASEVDPATARIVEYLAKYDVPLNVLFFRYFTDADRRYLARTWLVDDTRVAASKRATSGTTEQWNGQDWYVSFGEESSIRSWIDAQRYGFVSAGGGRWYSQTLRSLPIEARVFVCVPGGRSGYVGVGRVIGEAMPFSDAQLVVDGELRRMAELELRASYQHTNGAEDNDEYVVPIEWIATVPIEEAVWAKGMFANQNSACRLRSRFTLDELTKRFNLADELED